MNVVDILDILNPPAQWWVPVRADGSEVCPRVPYRPRAVWTVGWDQDDLYAMGFAASADGPLVATVPVDAAVRRGDRISIAGPASAAQVPVCELPGCGCSGEAHP